jgi:hypothetical protein
MKGPLEFRVLEQQTENPKDTLPPFWAKFIDQKFHPRQTIDDDEDEEEEKSPIVFWPWTIAVVLLGGLYLYKRYAK